MALHNNLVHLNLHLKLSFPEGFALKSKDFAPYVSYIFAVPQNSFSHSLLIHQCGTMPLSFTHRTLSFTEHVYWPDGLQALPRPKQNGLECIEDDEVLEKVT